MNTDDGAPEGEITPNDNPARDLNRDGDAAPTLVASTPLARGLRSAVAPAILDREIGRDQRLVVAAEAKVLAALPCRLTDDALAQAVGATLAELEEAVRAVHGDTIYRAMFRFRLKLAIKMLDDDETLSARAAARQCGFGYFGSFLRGFRQETGAQPRKAAKPLTMKPGLRSSALDGSDAVEDVQPEPRDGS